MAILRPFRALRPDPASAPRVAAVPYDVVSTEEARALAAGNPMSFLRVSRAEIELSPETNPYSDVVYATAIRNFETLKRTAPLLMEAEPSLYVYRLRMGPHEQNGVAGCFSLDDYDRDVIKKHERTRPDKEDDRTRHINELRAQTGPVLLAYRAALSIDRTIAHETQAAPLYDFAAADDVQHTIWRVSPSGAQSLVDAFAAVPALYIADGHHRAASASRTRSMARGDRVMSADAEANFFLAVAFADREMQILPYNRVVKDLGARSPDAFLAELKLGARAVVREGSPSPSRKGETSMYLGGKWYTMTFEHVDASDPIASLDVSLLQDRVLAPVLGIEDVRTDKRIDFVGGARGTRELESLVNSGKASAAFSMYPVSMNDLISVSDAGAIMPPKSTWFEPKLRDGLLSHLI